MNEFLIDCLLLSSRGLFKGYRTGKYTLTKPWKPPKYYSITFSWTYQNFEKTLFNKVSEIRRILPFKGTIVAKEGSNSRTALKEAQLSFCFTHHFQNILLYIGCTGTIFKRESGVTKWGSLLSLLQLWSFLYRHYSTIVNPMVGIYHANAHKRFVITAILGFGTHISQEILNCTEIWSVLDSMWWHITMTRLLGL